MKLYQMSYEATHEQGQLALLPKCDFNTVAHLLEHCTGIAEPENFEASIFQFL